MVAVAKVAKPLKSTFTPEPRHATCVAVSSKMIGKDQEPVQSNTS